MAESDNKQKPNLVKRMKSRAEEFAWGTDISTCGFKRRFQVKTARFLMVLARGFQEHRFGLHAAGLTLISLLSLVPILLLMLLLTKPCGMYEKARELLVTKTDQMIEQFFEQKGVEKTKLEEAALKLVKKNVKPEANSSEERAKAEPKAETAVPQPGENGRAAAATEAKVDAKVDEKVDSKSDGKKDAKKDEKKDPQADAKDFSQQARKLRDRVLGQVDKKINNFKFGIVTLIGFLILAWTVTSTFGQVEASMNEIWHVKTPRSIPKKLMLYSGTLMVLPFLLLLAVSLPILRTVKQALDATLGATSYTKWVGDAIVGLLNSGLFSFTVTFVFATLALALVFWAMPHRRVERWAAIKGGALTALLLMGWIRACILLQVNIASSGAAYGSFALVPILIVWTSFNWKIILIGSNMAYAFQCADSGVRDLPDERG